MVLTVHEETADTACPDTHLTLIVRIMRDETFASDTLTFACAWLLAGKPADCAVPSKHVHETVVDAVGPTMTAEGLHEITGSSVVLNTIGGGGGGRGAGGFVGLIWGEAEGWDRAVCPGLLPDCLFCGIIDFTNFRSSARGDPVLPALSLAIPPVLPPE